MVAAPGRRFWAAAVIGVLLALAWCTPASAAIALVQTGTVATGSGTGVTATLPSPSTSGNLLVAQVMDLNSGCASTTFSAPVGWSRAASVCRGTSGPVEIWYRPNTAAGVSSVAFTTGWAGANTRVQLSEWSGVSTVSPLDRTGTGSSGSSSTSLAATTTGSISESGELAVSVFQSSAGLTSLASGSGWTNMAKSAGTGYITDHRLSPTSGSTLTETVTASPREHLGAASSPRSCPPTRSPRAHRA